MPGKARFCENRLSVRAVHLLRLRTRHKMQFSEMQLFQPTQRPSVHEFETNGLKLRAFDLGGHLQARRLWREYFERTDAVIFMVDAADPQRFAEAKRVRTTPTR